jgi:hypothetical protein
MANYTANLIFKVRPQDYALGISMVNAVLAMKRWIPVSMSLPRCSSIQNYLRAWSMPA